MPTEHSVVLTWRSMHLADDAVRRILDERLAAEAGCSLLEHDLLAWLTAQPQRRLQMLKLADLLGVTRGGLTRIVDRLVERGWIDRDRPERNRREVYAVLTPHGQHAIEHARAIYLSALQQTLGTHLNQTERNELARITNKLLGALAGHDPPVPAPPPALTQNPPLVAQPSCASARQPTAAKIPGALFSAPDAARAINRHPG
jgi:DNA-binding MarR family transcriptional regulator